MHDLPVYLFLTTCVLFAQCFGVLHVEKFKETNKENLRNSFGITSGGVHNTNSKLGTSNGDKYDLFKENKNSSNIWQNGLNSFSDRKHFDATMKNDTSDKGAKSGGKRDGVIDLLNIIDIHKVKMILKSPIYMQDNLTIQNCPTSNSSKENVDSNIDLHDVVQYIKTLNLGIGIDSTGIKILFGHLNETELPRSITDSMQNILKPPQALSNPMLSYVLVPALTMAGLLPWILPGIRMAAGFVQMINQMAFTAGLFALVRGYIFDHRPDEHVVYVNQGYHKKNQWHESRKKSSQQGKEELLKKLIPMLAMPFIMQATFLPMVLLGIKFMLLQSIFLGKMAVIFWTVNLIRNMLLDQQGQFYSHNVHVGHS